MATLPTTGDDLDLIGFAVESQPGYTHKLDIDRGRVGGMTDEQDGGFASGLSHLECGALCVPHLLP